jgi:hypothetical protein
VKQGIQATIQPKVSLKGRFALGTNTSQVPPAEGSVVEQWQEHGWVHKVIVAGDQQKEYAVDVKAPLPVVMYPLDKHRELLREFKDEQGFTHKVRVPPPPTDLNLQVFALHGEGESKDSKIEIEVRLSPCHKLSRLYRFLFGRLENPLRWMPGQRPSIPRQTWTAPCTKLVIRARCLHRLITPFQFLLREERSPPKNTTSTSASRSNPQG